MQFLTQGYEMDANEILNSAKFSRRRERDDHREGYRTVQSLANTTCCLSTAKRMLPIYPMDSSGLSKVGRVVGCIAPAGAGAPYAPDIELDQGNTEPAGRCGVIEASHLCMMMRGVEKQNSVTTTSAFWGSSEKNETRSEFVKLISAEAALRTRICLVVYLFIGLLGRRVYFCYPDSWLF